MHRLSDDRLLHGGIRDPVEGVAIAVLDPFRGADRREVPHAQLLDGHPVMPGDERADGLAPGEVP